jgi:hypothetical protein
MQHPDSRVFGHYLKYFAFGSPAMDAFYARLLKQVLNVEPACMFIL